MKLVIAAKYIAPTNTKCARVKLTCLRGSHLLEKAGFDKTLFKTNAQGYAATTIPWNYEFNRIDDHLPGEAFNNFIAAIGNEEIYSWDVE